jgi:hypothetical protein
MYNGAIYQFSQGFAGSPSYADVSFAGESGLFADEYTTTISGTYVTRETHSGTPVFENSSGPYEMLQTARRSMNEALKNLSAHGGTLPTSYIGEMHALKGYVYLLLSELYCEGVPFSDLNTTGLVDYGAPETLVEMNTNAIAQFDSVAAYSTDSTRILQLAAVGKGRAYLNLGDFANAKAAVASVQTNFVYATTYGATSYTNYIPAITAVSVWMSDHEGGNGLDYASSPDVRLAKILVSSHPYPAKFPNGGTSIPLATGIEARLIEAEAALHDNDILTWTTILNTLRASGGTAVVPALTADSTTTAADTLRVNVMFRERAFWMFGTGHRQGDMRRLIRQYGRVAEQVYSVGVLNTSTNVPVAYLTTPVLDVPQTEIDGNPNYHGCLNHDA